MHRTLEALFRRLSRIVLLLVLLPILGFAVGFALPRGYQAQASLWAEHRFEVIGSTGTESDLLATEAETQATALTELLQTRAFDLAVANQTQLPDTLSTSVRANPNARADALVQAINDQVLVQAQGTYLFTITYSNKSPQIAQQVVAAVIKSYGDQSQGISVVEGQNLLQAYQAQLPDAQKAASQAAQQEQQYSNQHTTESAADLANDPQYILLHSQTQQAQATLTTLQNQIATIKQAIGLQSGGPGSLFQVIDQPTVKGVSRLRTLLLATGGGLLLALLFVAIYLALLVRRDRALYTAAEVQRATEQRVLLQLPLLPASTMTASRRELALASERSPSRRRIKGPRG